MGGGAGPWCESTAVDPERFLFFSCGRGTATGQQARRPLPVAADTLWAEQDPKLSLSIGPIPRWHFPLASGLIPRDLAKGRKHVGANPTLNVVHREVKIGSIVHFRALEGLQERVPGAGQSLVQPALNM